MNTNQDPTTHPTGSETPPTHRKLIPITLAEIRRLLNLDTTDSDRIDHALHWSAWRRRHQTIARRAHYLRRLPLQVRTI